MSMFGAALFAFLLAVPDDKPASKFPIGRETTYVTGPVDKDGYIDYQAALNERLGKGITPDKNAHVLIWRAIGPSPEGTRMPAEYFKRLGMDEPPERGDYIIGPREFARDRLKLDADSIDAFFDQLSRARQRPWRASEYPNAAAWLQANEKPLHLVIEATTRPDYFNPLVAPRNDDIPGMLHNALLPSTQRCREVASALAARAMLRADEGKVEEAWQDLYALHRLGRLVARGGTLFEGLVGIALDQIATNADIVFVDLARINSARAQALMKELRELPPFPPISEKVAFAERLMFLDLLQHIRRTGLGALDGLSGRAPRKSTPTETRLLEKIDWEPAHHTCNQWLDRMTSVMRLKNRSEREKAFESFDKDLRALMDQTKEFDILTWLSLAAGGSNKAVSQKFGDILVTRLFPATRKVQDAYDRAEQTQRNLQIAFALAAYQRDNGRYPAALAELAPKYLPSTPDDLFSGKPLIYRPQARGYLFYSVGVNGQDEGGHTSDDDPRGDDLPVQMPLPELKPKN